MPPLHGGPLKDRRVVIVTETAEIILTNPIYVVACTSSLKPEQKGEAVALPWHPRRGVSSTGFTKETWAVPKWLDEVLPTELRDYQGYVPADKLRQIIAMLPSDPSDGPTA